jgi:hypothetical protein
MRAVARVVSGLGVFVLATAVVASAQRPQTRQGFWIGFGIGGGSAGVSFAGSDSFNLGRETFLKGGPGFSYQKNDDGTNKYTDTGFGFMFGAGYDIRVGTKISLTPVASFYWGSLGDLTVEGPGGGATSGFGLKQNVIDFQLGITFH